MPYLDRVLMETLRKYPPLPFIDRRCVKDYKIPDTDIVIEEDTSILIPLFGIHYDPEIYPDPIKFDLERYSEENISKIPKCAHIPFGAGPRICAGEKFGLVNVKLGLATIFANYEVIKTDKTPFPLEFDMKALILTVRGGLPLRLVKIDKS